MRSTNAWYLYLLLTSKPRVWTKLSYWHAVVRRQDLPQSTEFNKKQLTAGQLIAVKRTNERSIYFNSVQLPRLLCRPTSRFLVNTASATPTSHHTNISLSAQLRRKPDWDRPHRRGRNDRKQTACCLPRVTSRPDSDDVTKTWCPFTPPPPW